MRRRISTVLPVTAICLASLCQAKIVEERVETGVKPPYTQILKITTKELAGDFERMTENYNGNPTDGKSAEDLLKRLTDAPSAYLPANFSLLYPLLRDKDPDQALLWRNFAMLRAQLDAARCPGAVNDANFEAAMPSSAYSKHPLDQSTPENRQRISIAMKQAYALDQATPYNYDRNWIYIDRYSAGVSDSYLFECLTETAWKKRMEEIRARYKNGDLADNKVSNWLYTPPHSSFRKASSQPLRTVPQVVEQQAKGIEPPYDKLITLDASSTQKSMKDARARSIWGPKSSWQREEYKKFAERIRSNAGDYFPWEFNVLSQHLKTEDPDQVLLWQRFGVLRAQLDAARCPKSVNGIFQEAMPLPDYIDRDSPLNKDTPENRQRLVKATKKAYELDKITPYNYDRNWVYVNEKGASEMIRIYDCLPEAGWKKQMEKIRAGYRDFTGSDQ